MPSATTELRHLTPDALRAKAEELQKEIRKHSFHGVRRQEKNVNHLRNLRHELARVLTISTERFREEQASRSNSKQAQKRSAQGQPRATSKGQPAGLSGSAQSNVEGLTILTEREKTDSSRLQV